MLRHDRRSQNIAINISVSTPPPLYDINVTTGMHVIIALQLIRAPSLLSWQNINYLVHKNNKKIHHSLYLISITKAMLYRTGSSEAGTNPGKFANSITSNYTNFSFVWFTQSICLISTIRVLRHKICTLQNPKLSSKDNLGWSSTVFNFIDMCWTTLDFFVYNLTCR